MNALEVLQKTRRLIDKPEYWVKGVFAQDADWGEVQPTSPEACSFCLLGALSAACKGGPEARRSRASYLVHRALDEFVADGEVVSIVAFNDNPNTYHDDVLACVDRAIQLAKEWEATCE